MRIRIHMFLGLLDPKSNKPKNSFKKISFFLTSWRSMPKIAGSGSASGSICQVHGSADPDPVPYQPHNVMDPQHCCSISSPLPDRCDQVPGEQSGEGRTRAGGRGGRHPVAGPGQALHTEGKDPFPFPSAPSLSQLCPPGFTVYGNMKTTLKGQH